MLRRIVAALASPRRPPRMAGVAPDGAKQIVFIRHAQSLAQIAHHRKRTSDESLVDCDLSPHGHSTLGAFAARVRSAEVEADLVVASPLTRAARTALTLFPELPCVVHPGLAEISTSLARVIPENRGASRCACCTVFNTRRKGRPWKQVTKTLSLPAADAAGTDVLAQLGWPHRNAEHDALVGFERWLAARPERRVILVGYVVFGSRRRLTRPRQGTRTGRKPRSTWITFATWTRST